MIKKESQGIHQRIEIKTPAKVNLFLKVIGKRNDGFHELVTWMQKLSLYDTLKLEVIDGPGVVFSCSDSQLPTGAGNLVCKAATKFYSCVPEMAHKGICIHLDKEIPVAAGLGGGSSDAGAVIKGMNYLFGSPLSEQEMIDAAVQVGADVPFFVTNHSAVLAKGVGEKMTPVDSCGDVTFVLVNPGISVSTKWVFDNFVLTDDLEKCKFSPLFKKDKISLSLDDLSNDLEKVTEAAHPVIKEIKSELEKWGAKHVLMSGSGPTVFGIFPNSDKNSCIAVDDAVKTMRLRFKYKVYKAKTSAGAWPSG